MDELSNRQRRLLQLIIEEYVASAAPIGSQTLVRKGGLNISPATIRNEMTELEEAGYIYQPHTSAGRIPTDIGYRYFIETLLQESELSPDEQRTILHQFHQIELELDEWTRLAASILAQIVHNAAVVSTPSARQCKLKLVELVPVQDEVALLVVVLHEGHVRQKMITIPEGMTQDSLRVIANKLTTSLQGRTAAGIATKSEPISLTPLEEMVRDDVVRIMRQLDQLSYGDIVFDGLVMMLRQPEFFGSERINQILETLQQRDIVAAMAPEVVQSEGVRVIIGKEINSPPLQECTVILARYGDVEKIAGVLGVLGPKRMHYEKAIPAVRYVSRVMTGLLEDLYS
jgi:heat-inducible transcriptional repressor